MVGSLFNPTSPTQTRPASHLRLHGQYVPAPIPAYANKNPFSVTTRTIKPSVPKPATAATAARRPSLTRTQSTPSITRPQSTPSRTTAPMFPDEILENLYISDLETARAVLSPNYSAPGRPRIKYVLTLLDRSKDQPQAFVPTAAEISGNADFVLKLIKLSDYTDVNILEKLPEACAFIRESLANKDGGVLVHCRKGVSRSGSVIVAYLMQELGLGFDEALQQAKRARGKIWPNRAFGEQLRMWKDLNYNLADEHGQEKLPYRDWKAKSRFRPEVFEL